MPWRRPPMVPWVIGTEPPVWADTPETVPPELETDRRSATVPWTRARPPAYTLTLPSDWGRTVIPMSPARELSSWFRWSTRPLPAPPGPAATTALLRAATCDRRLFTSAVTDDTWAADDCWRELRLAEAWLSPDTRLEA